MGDVAVAAEHLARADDPHVGRVRVLQHVVDLRGRGVGAQEEAPAALEVERVLHVAGRVVRRHVEGLEVVVVVLHLGAVVHLVAHGHEDVLELLADDGQRVAPAHEGAAAGQGRVEPVAAERLVAPASARGPRRAPSSLSLDRRLERVQLLAGLAPLGLGQLAERLQQRGERPRLAAQEAVAQRLEGRRVRHRGHRGLELRPRAPGPSRGPAGGSSAMGSGRGAPASGAPAVLPQALGRAAFADSTSLPKAASSVAAISASDLRSSAIPAPLSPAMSWL